MGIYLLKNIDQKFNALHICPLSRIFIIKSICNCFSHLLKKKSLEPIPSKQLIILLSFLK